MLRDIFTDCDFYQLSKNNISGYNLIKWLYVPKNLLLIKL